MGVLASAIEWLVWLAVAAFGVYWQRKRQAEGREPERASRFDELKFWQAGLLSLVLGLGVAGYLGLLRSQSPFLTLERPKLEDLEVLSLDGYERLLVLAPHSDDEGLGAAGLR